MFFFPVKTSFLNIDLPLDGVFSASFTLCLILLFPQAVQWTLKGSWAWVCSDPSLSCIFVLQAA